jgi:hypothetical protein
VASDYGVYDMGRHVGGVLAGEPTAPSADGSAGCVNDESFTHYFNLT